MKAAIESANAWFDEAFKGCRVIAVLRGLGPERTLELAESAWSLGVGLVEVTLQSPADVVALAATVEAGRGRGLPVGAGTVISSANVRDAAEAGAAFTVSPGFAPSVVQASVGAGMPSLPGVATGSEVQAADALGLRWVKVFPAARLTPAWFTDMAGPFPHMRFVATGGISASNATEFLAAGAQAVGLGSALADPNQLERIAPLLRAP